MPTPASTGILDAGEDGRARFEAKVIRGESCWGWKGCRDSSGRGLLYVSGKLQKAHRVSWELYHESEIPSGRYVRPTCGNRDCVNPEHLQVSKGTKSVDPRRRHTDWKKLDPELRAAADRGESRCSLAHRLDVPIGRIYDRSKKLGLKWKVHNRGGGRSANARETEEMRVGRILALIDEENRASMHWERDAIKEQRRSLRL